MTLHYCMAKGESGSTLMQNALTFYSLEPFALASLLCGLTNFIQINNAAAFSHAGLLLGLTDLAIGSDLITHPNRTPSSKQNKTTLDPELDNRCYMKSTICGLATSCHHFCPLRGYTVQSRVHLLFKAQAPVIT